MNLPAAYGALGRALRDALTASGVLSSPASFAIDPPSGLEPDEAGAALQTAAALVGLEINAEVRFLGSPRRYVVERLARLELALSGPDPEERLTLSHRAIAALAVVPERDPTLGGTCERLELLSLEDEDWPPSGQKILITFLLRVRSADALGMS